MNWLKKNLSQFWPFLAAALLLLLLLWKNPFSVRTLIPNFEPFPDTFHYLSPPRCLVKGQGFKMCLPETLAGEELVGRDASVPPLYSLFMIPFFVLTQDPRVVYFLNLVLSFSSLTFFYLILRKIGLDKLGQALVLLIYTSSYFIYWFPTLIMAENLLLTVFMLGFYLLWLKVSWKNLILAGLVAASFYGTKYAAVGLTGVYSLLYLIKIWRQAKKRPVKLKLKKLGLFLSLALGLYFLFGGWNTVQGVVVSGWQMLTQFLPSAQVGGGAGVQTTAETTQDWWFGTRFLLDNLKFYGRALIGKPTIILWDAQPLITPWIMKLGLFGLGLGLLKKKKRWFAGAALLLLIGQVMPILPFYVADSRYATVSLPVILIGLALLLRFLKTWLHQKTVFYLLIWPLLIFSLGGFYLWPKLPTLRKQIVLNLKYAEQPWWYLSVQEFNTYFAEHKFEKAPYLITLHSPYYLDYFGNRQYQPLPLSNQQDFRGSRPQVWGIPQEPTLAEIYRSKLEAGYPVYLTNYGVNATGSFAAAEKNIHQAFVTEEVKSGCHQLCNLYRLSLPNHNE